LKDFDFKQFMIEKGERVGLGVAGAVMALLLVFGFVKLLSGGTASGTKAAIDEKKTRAKSKIDTSTPPPADAEKDAKELMVQVNFESLDPDDFRPPYPLLMPSSVEDTKRRSPQILVPTEVQVDLVLAPV